MANRVPPTLLVCCLSDFVRYFAGGVLCCYTSISYTDTMKTVLITGASSGIGAATARRFAAEGFNIVFSYNANQAGAAAITAELEERGVEVLAHHANLNDSVAANQLVDAAQSHFGQIDVLVNNAGGYIDGDEWDGDVDVWQQTLSQNLVSVMNVSKYCAAHFLERQAGVIVNVASRHGLRGSHEEIAYAAAKAGVINVTHAYATLLAPYGRANSVSPGAVNTGYWLTAPADELAATIADKPLQRLIEPSEVAEAILYLGTNRSAGTTGQNLVVN